MVNLTITLLYPLTTLYCTFISVFIRKGKDKKAQLVLLDHGLYDTLTPQNRQSLSLLYKAIVLRDEDSMEKYSKELGVDGNIIFTLVCCVTYTLMYFMILEVMVFFFGHIWLCIVHIEE